MKVVELVRVKPVDGDRASAAIPSDVRGTLLIYNPLAAPIYLNLSTADPKAASHDLACPGEALMCYPIGETAGHITAVIDYPGAVPADDVAAAVISATGTILPAFVGPLNA